MKMYLISDNVDTLAGMRLAGVEGVVAHTHDEVMSETKKAVSKPDIGVLIFTEKSASVIKEELDMMKITLHTPLIIEIPDRHGSRDIADSINRLVQESIGLKL